MIKNYVLLVFVLLMLSANTLSAQTHSFSDKAVWAKKIPFTMLETKNKDLTITDILKLKVLFQQPQSYSSVSDPNNIYWIQLDFRNVLQNKKDADRFNYLKFNSFDFGEIFLQNDNVLVAKPIGRFNKESHSDRIKADKYYSEMAIDTLKLIEGRYIFFRVKRIQFKEPFTNWNFSLTNNSTINTYAVADVNALIPTYINAGIGIVMCILIFVFYIYFKRLEFLWYSIFILLHLIYLTRDEIQILPLFSGNFSFEFNWFLDSMAMLVAISYMLFSIYYIDMKKEYPFAFKVFRISIFAHVLAFFAQLTFYFTNFYEGHIFFQVNFPALTMITALLSFSYILFTLKNRLSIIYLVGSISLVIGVSTHYYLNDAFDPLLYDKTYIIIGATFETVIFAIGLTYKVHIEHIEKLNFQQEAFINKTKALRAQINPHFIFNSLSSIQHLVTTNQRVSALSYLTKFSRLTRSILESSIETNVVLRDEIKMLEDYLELESLRFDNSFNYSFLVDKDVAVDVVEIPALILQPFVENAIIHGLLPKKTGPKNLMIKITRGEEYIICEVDDNGIGRDAAKQRVNINRLQKKSRGLEVTKQRLEGLGAEASLIEILDKNDDNGNSVGTTVRIKIPF